MEFQLNRPIVCCDEGGPVAEGRDAGEAGRTAAPVPPVREGYGRSTAGYTRVDAPDNGEALRVGKGKRPKRDVVQYAQQRGGRTDAEIGRASWRKECRS